jgi:hypothetical protein
MKTQLSLARAAALATLLPIAAASGAVPPVAPQSVPAATKASIGKPTPPALPVTPFYTVIYAVPFTLTGALYGTQTLGITSIIATNSNNNPQGVYLYKGAPSTPGNCSTGTIYNTNNYLVFTVPAAGSLVMPFPTPLAFAPLNGTSGCVFVFTDAQNVWVNITGFLQ